MLGRDVLGRDACGVSLNVALQAFWHTSAVFGSMMIAWVGASMFEAAAVVGDFKARYFSTSAIASLRASFVDCFTS